MPKRRQIFEVFTKAELVAIARDFGFKGWAVLNKGDIVERLARKRSIGMDEVLNTLGYSDLIKLCSKLGLDTSGTSKQVLIDRILGKEYKHQPKQKEIFKPAKPKKKKLEQKKTNQAISGEYIDVAGLCKVATIEEIEDQGWSLNPGRYVGVAEGAVDDFDFKERLQELNEELENLNAEAGILEERIAENISRIIEV